MGGFTHASENRFCLFVDFRPSNISGRGGRKSQGIDIYEYLGHSQKLDTTFFLFPGYIVNDFNFFFGGSKSNSDSVY